MQKPLFDRLLRNLADKMFIQRFLTCAGPMP
jgi:hypothetical protein